MRPFCIDVCSEPLITTNDNRTDGQKSLSTAVRPQRQIPPQETFFPGNNQLYTKLQGGLQLIVASRQADDFESFTVIQRTYLAHDTAATLRRFHTANADIVCRIPTTQLRQQRPRETVTPEGITEEKNVRK